MRVLRSLRFWRSFRNHPPSSLSPQPPSFTQQEPPHGSHKPPKQQTRFKRRKGKSHPQPNPQHSLKNTLKNITLAVLTLLLAVLSAANWLTGLSIAQLPTDNYLRRLYDRFSGGAVGYELRSSGIAAAEPCQIALSSGGKLYAVQYSPSELDTAFATVQPVWRTLLSATKTCRVASEEELCNALSAGDYLLLHYDGAVPLGSIANWIGGQWESNLPVHTLLYSDRRRQLFLRAKDGTLYTTSVKADEETLRRAQRDFHGVSCMFAGKAYDVWAETLLFERENLSLAQLTEEPPDWFAPQGGASLQTLLNAFFYTPYARSYPEQGGAVRVFVSEGSTLRISDQGLVQFTASGSSTVRAYEEEKPTGFSTLDAQIDCARQVLDTTVRAVETGTRPSLYSVQEANGRTTLVFLQTHSGVPILTENDFATLVFQGNELLSATVYLTKFQETDTWETVLPAKQAAASVPSSRFYSANSTDPSDSVQAANPPNQQNLTVVYRRKGECYRPERCFLLPEAE